MRASRSSSRERLYPISPKKRSLYSSCGSPTHSTATSDFSVHTGPSSPRTPLGTSISSCHFIEPKPGYITEYESAFVLPLLEKERRQREEKETTHDLDSKGKGISSAWNRLEECLNEILNIGLEKNLSAAALNAVKDRRLDPQVEYLYNIFKERLQLQVGQMKFSYDQKAEEQRMRRLCENFIAACDTMKGATLLKE